jgi:uncharacterized protein (DUF2267 family)
MVNTANTWLADVAEAFGTKDRRFAYRVLRAWLHTLRDRLTVERAAQFAAQLPELVRGVYYEGWNPSRVPLKYGREEFVERFATEANIPTDDVRRVAARLMVIMQAHLSPGQLDHVLVPLPGWLRDIAVGVDDPVHPEGSPTTEVAEDRIARLEEQVSALGEALRTLAHGLEERPDVKPNEHRVAKAARQAHELLLAAKV